MNKKQEAFRALAEAIVETGPPSCQQSDPDAWFPEAGQPSPHMNLAIKLCKACPVRQLCLEYALVNDERHGIWGGLYTRERDRLTRKRNKAISSKLSTSEEKAAQRLAKWKADLSNQS